VASLPLSISILSPHLSKLAHRVSLTDGREEKPQKRKERGFGAILQRSLLLASIEGHWQAILFQLSLGKKSTNKGRRSEERKVGKNEED